MVIVGLTAAGSKRLDLLCLQTCNDKLCRFCFLGEIAYFMLRLICAFRFFFAFGSFSSSFFADKYFFFDK